MELTGKNTLAKTADHQETPEEFIQRGGSVEKVGQGATGEDCHVFSWNSSSYPNVKKTTKPKNTEQSGRTGTQLHD